MEHINGIQRGAITTVQCIWKMNENAFYTKASPNIYGLADHTYEWKFER